MKLKLRTKKNLNDKPQILLRKKNHKFHQYNHTVYQIENYDCEREKKPEAYIFTCSLHQNTNSSFCLIIYIKMNSRY